MSTDLSRNEQLALEWLIEKHGSVLVTGVPDKNEKDLVFGTLTPGLGLFRKLERKGLVYFTEEEPLVLDDGTLFEFTPSIELA